MNADVFRLDIDMSSRTNLVIASLAACSIGSLLGLYFVLKFNSPALAMFASVAIPALMAWKTNMADVVLPAKVAFFGLLAGCLVTIQYPIVSGRFRALLNRGTEKMIVLLQLPYYVQFLLLRRLA